MRNFSTLCIHRTVKRYTLTGTFLIQIGTLNAASSMLSELDFMQSWKEYQSSIQPVVKGRVPLFPKLQDAKRQLHQYFNTDTAKEEVASTSVVDPILRHQKEVHEEMKYMLSRHPSDQTVNILWGRTGAGKTTLKDFFEEVSLLKEDARTETLIAVPHKGSNGEDLGGLTIKGAGIGTGYSPTTKKPTFSSSGLFLDLPGSEEIGKGDEHKAEEEVQRAYHFQQILDKYRRFNLLVTIPESDLDVAGRGEGALKTLHSMATVFPKGDDHLNHVTVMVTHASGINGPEIFRNRVSQVLRDREKEGLLSSDDKKLLEYIRNKECTVCIARKPTEQGGLSRDFVQCYKGDKTPHSFDPKTSVNKYNGEVKVTLSPAGERYLETLSKKITTKVADAFTSLRMDVRRRVRSLIEQHNGTAEALRNRFRILGNDLSNSTSLQDLRTCVRQFDAQTASEFDGFINQYEVIRALLPEVPELELSNNGSLSRLASSIKSFGNSPVWDGESTVSGHIVGTGDARKYYDGISSSHLNLVGFGGLFLDQDIVAPGKNLTLISPLWKATGEGKRVVNLNGASGDNSPTPKQASQNMDGFPGSPGGNGGHFYGILDRYYDDSGDFQRVPNASILSVHVDGGRGGRGQNGGDGENGVNGKDGRKESLLAISKDRIPWYSQLFMNLVIERKTDGSPGTSGKDAGKGGAGGNGGLHGSITFQDPDGLMLQTTYGQSLKDGEKGENGEPGEPGEAGKNGHMVSGEWGTLTPSPLRVGAGRLVGACIAFYTPVLSEGLIKMGLLSAGATLGVTVPADAVDQIADFLRRVQTPMKIGSGVLVPSVFNKFVKKEGWVGEFNDVHEFQPKDGKKPTDLNEKGIITPLRTTFDYMSSVHAAGAAWKQWKDN